MRETTAKAAQEFAIWRALNPPRRLIGYDEMCCPWCGEDQLNAQDAAADSMTCADCGRPIELDLTKDSLELIGKITPADRQYLEWRGLLNPSDIRQEEK